LGRKVKSRISDFTGSVSMHLQSHTPHIHVYREIEGGLLDCAQFHKFCRSLQTDRTYRLFFPFSLPFFQKADRQTDRPTERSREENLGKHPTIDRPPSQPAFLTCSMQPLGRSVSLPQIVSLLSQSFRRHRLCMHLSVSVSPSAVRQSLFEPPVSSPDGLLTVEACE